METSPLPVGWAVSMRRGMQWIAHTARGAGIALLQLSYLEALDDDEGVALIREQARSVGARVCAVTFGFGGEDWSDVPSIFRTCGLAPLSTRDERLRRLETIAAFARKLGVGRLAGHVGRLPEDAGERRELGEAIGALCDRLRVHGQTLLMETGQEPAERLARFIAAVARPNLRVNFDPANFVLYAQGDATEAWRTLRPWVDAVHGKDARPPADPRYLGTEMRVGEGEVGFEKWLDEALESGFTGPVIVETGVAPEQLAADLLRARELIQQIARRQSERRRT